MLYTLIILAVWAQPIFPPGSACTVEFLFPCSFETAIDASEPLKAAAQTLSKEDLIDDYRTGKYDVEFFEPILFSDSGTTYGLTEAQTHPVISDRVVQNVLTTLQSNSQQDWLETDWGDDIDESTKFVYDVDLPNAMNSAVFLRTDFADPWAGECSTNDYTAVCAQWNMAIAVAKTFYNLAKCSDSASWDSAVSNYESGMFGVDGSYATLFSANGDSLASTNFTTHDTFPTGITMPRRWTNFTNATWGYFLEFRSFDGVSYKVLGELSIPQTEPPAPKEPVEEVSDEIADIVSDHSKNATEQEEEIMDIVDETDVTSVVIVTNETKTTISEGTVDTVSDETTSTELPPSLEPTWIRFDDSIGVLTYTDDQTAVISLIYDGYTEVADGACNSLYDMSCNRDAVPYYASNVVLDLLNAGTNATAVDLILDQVRAGYYDKANDYKPSVMNEAGIHVAQSSPDSLYDALVTSNAEPDFSQHRLQLAWIATASGGEPQWVSMNLKNEPWEIYVQAVATNIVMLGYRDVSSDSPGGPGADAAGEGNDDSESNDTVLYIIIGLCVFVALVVLISIFSWFFCRPKPQQKSGPESFGVNDVEIADAEEGEAIGEDPDGHWVQYVGATDPGPSSGTELTGTAFHTEGEYEQMRTTTKSVDVHM